MSNAPSETTLAPRSPRQMAERLRSQIKSAWEQMGERVRNAFELPTREDLAQLQARLDQIEAKLSELAPAKSRKTVADRRVKK